ncbi:MAG: hypothetical protein ACLPXB_06125, partial [Thiobacillaceae bacterium]
IWVGQGCRIPHWPFPGVNISDSWIQPIDGAHDRMRVSALSRLMLALTIEVLVYPDASPAHRV